MLILCYITLSALCTTAWSGRRNGVIPQHLEECYMQPAPRTLPLTVGTLTELISKTSYNLYTPVSLSQQSADILNWFALDGLEREPQAEYNEPDIIPFHRTGFQALKQDLLFEKLIQMTRKPFEGAPLSLTPAEKCSLHFMVSTAVDPWQRGDEAKVCQNAYQQLSETGTRSSACPVEGGVVRTAWGSVNGGRILGGLLAALAPQSVSLDQLLPQPTASNESIDNIWAATLAGDLAEVAVLQSPPYDMDVVIGIKGIWNDSYIPTKFYFHDVPQHVIDKRSWQITDAEILGGIDGLLIGAMAVELKQTMPDLRLSQLLEMYYLESRFHGQSHACKRKSAFNTFIRNKKHILITQTQNCAKLLSSKATSYFTNATVVDGRSVKAVDKFLRYYSELLETENCPDPLLNSPMLNLNMIMDATWTPYATLQFLMQFTQDNDIGFYGGRIVTINEDSMKAVVHGASSPSSLYQTVNISQDYQDTVSLVYRKAFVTLKNIIEESNKRENELSIARRSTQDVVVVIGYSSAISDKDLQRCKDILMVIKMQNPALRMVYWSSHVGAPGFVRLTAVPRSHNDAILTTDGPTLPHLLHKLQDTLQSPRNLKPAYCKGDSRRWPESMYDEFITPGETISYWIHPDYLCGSQDVVKITFKNYGYGELSACMSRSPAERGECQEVGPGREETHALLWPCLKRGVPPPAPQQWHPDCLPVYFTLTATRSYNNCSGYECRYPDQVKFTIIVQDLQCVNVNRDVCAGSYRPQTSLYSTLVLCVIIVNLLQFIL